MLIILLLCSGIDMIGDMPNRVITTEKPVIEKTVVVVPEEPVEVKKTTAKKKKKPEPECVPQPPSPEVNPEPDTKLESDTKPDTELESDTKPDTKQEAEAKMIPFPEVDELEPGEKEVEVLGDSEAGYKYYVYRSHNCGPCKMLVSELQKNVDEKDLILSYERTTKSGKRVVYVPTLEVYKDGVLVHQQVGYTSWKTIQGKLGEID